MGSKRARRGPESCRTSSRRLSLGHRRKAHEKIDEMKVILSIFLGSLAATVLATEIPDAKLQAWGPCKESTECDTAQFGSCTLLAVNKSSVKDVWKTYDPNPDPRRGMTVVDAGCSNNIQRCSKFLGVECSLGTCVFSPGKAPLPKDCTLTKKRVLSVGWH